VIQEGLLSCDLELVVDWMKLHLPKQLVCQDLLDSNAQMFDEYIEQALVFAHLTGRSSGHPDADDSAIACKDWSRGLVKTTFLRAFGQGTVARYAKVAFPREHEEFLQDVRVATRAMRAQAKTELSTLAAFAELTYEEEYRNEFLKAAKVANRKVKVMWIENGVEKCGWISKRKNNKSSGGKRTKPLITRVMGATAAPQVQVFNISADIPSLLPRHDCSFSKDAWHYKETAKRKVPSRYHEGEFDTVRCFPPMSFYNKLARSEIAKLVGSKRFAISWEGKFKQNRYRGLEKERVVCEDGKTRLRTGYYIPNDYITITFQRYSEANAFINADFDDTRFSGAVADFCGTYANLHPVDAAFCPDYDAHKVQYVSM
jgi:hypothetical protein